MLQQDSSQNVVIEAQHQSHVLCPSVHHQTGVLSMHLIMEAGQVPQT